MELEDSWKQLDQATELVRYADTKAGLVLTVNGVLVGLVVVRIQAGGFIHDHPVTAVALLVAIVLLTASVAVNIAAVMPRTGASDRPRSLLRFSSVAARFTTGPEKYIEEHVALARDPEALQREIAAQIWSNQVVADQKYRYVRWGLILLSGALAATGLAGLGALLGG